MADSRESFATSNRPAPTGVSGESPSDDVSLTSSAARHSRNVLIAIIFNGLLFIDTTNRNKYQAIFAFPEFTASEGFVGKSGAVTFWRTVPGLSMIIVGRSKIMRERSRMSGEQSRTIGDRSRMRLYQSRTVGYRSRMGREQSSVASHVI